MYDIVVIGAGPMGIAVGVEAKRKNLSCLILEKGSLVNSIYHFPQNMTFFSSSEKLEIGNVPFVSNNDKPTRSEALEYFRRVIEHWELKINNYEEVQNVDKREDVFEVQTTKAGYKAKNVVVATGFYGLPNLMRIPGEDLPKVQHYYKESHPFINKNVLVVGAANSACDAALELYHKKANVTMLIRGSEISERVKYWTKPNIENRIKEGSITAYFKSEVLEITENNVRINTPKGENILGNDFVLAMTGYSPDYEFLNKIGIICEDDKFDSPTYDSETHETSVHGLFLAGVVCGGKKTNKYYIENSKNHAEMILEEVMREEERK